MRAIWKYHLAEPGSSVTHLMPHGAEFVHVGLQEHEPFPVQAWFLVDPSDEPLVYRTFALVGTGWEFDDGHCLGTVIHDDSRTVWHLIEHDDHEPAQT